MASCRSQFALPMLLAVAALAHAQNGAVSKGARQGSAPSAVSTPPAADRVSTPPPTAHGAASGAKGSTVTGVPKYRAGMRGKLGSVAATATSAVSVTGGKGDDITGIDPKAGSLAVPQLKNSLGVSSGTAIHVRLKQSIDSGHARNGDMVEGVLAAALGKAAAGSPVTLTVVAAAAAGTMTSAGELSLQVISINGETILSNVITAEGEEGKTEFADDTPGRGTEAIFTADKPLELPAA